MEACRDFGTKLKQLRKARKLSIEDVAAATGVAERTLSAYERNERTPKDNTKVNLCNFYGVDVASIFFTNI